MAGAGSTRIFLTVALLAVAAGTAAAQAAEAPPPLCAGPLTGYDDGFFITSEGGSFLLRTNIEGQVRYVGNHTNQPTGADEDELGFQLRRTRIDFRGHAFNPRLFYRLRLSANRGNGNTELEYFYIGYKFGPEWLVQIGQFKPLFVREEDVNGFSQLAVERSYVADYYTIDYTQGASVAWQGRQWRAAAAAHDGSYARDTEFQLDSTNGAVSGRVEFMPFGSWKQFNDFTSGSCDAFGLLIGLAADYENGEDGSGANAPDVFKYTADVSLESPGANAFAAVYGQQLLAHDSAASGLPTNLDGAEQSGFVMQAGVFLVPQRLEAFGRYEWLDFDRVYFRNNGGALQAGTRNLSDDTLRMVTAGANYYVFGQNIKFTLDAVYAFDAVPVANTGSGILASAQPGQTTIRTQVQFRF